MNYRKRIGLALLFILSIAIVQAQDHPPLNEPDPNKPRLFDHLPEKIKIETSELATLLNGTNEPGKTINVHSRSKKISLLKGKIISASKKSDKAVKSIVIRSTDFSGAAFSLSSSTTADGTVKYKGRIISLQHGDAYVLQEEDGEYFLQKKSIYELMSE